MSARRPALVFFAIGVLLLTNPLWLFPHEGDIRYTYERSEIVVENGTLTYDGKGVVEFAEENSLDPIECQSYDDEQPRACSFDSHLATRGAATVPDDFRGRIEPEFVRIDEAYYRRVHSQNESADTGVTHDVERVTARTVLAESATNISGLSNAFAADLELRVAVSGDTVTSFEDLSGDELGNIYRRDGSFYTVVGTDEKTIDHGLPFHPFELSRYALMVVGLVFIVGVLSFLAGDQDR